MADPPIPVLPIASPQGALGQLERDEMRLVAARDGPHFSHARIHLSGLLDLAFSDSVRPHFYFAWGCFRNFGSRSAMYPRAGHEAVNAWRRGEAIQLQAIML